MLTFLTMVGLTIVQNASFTLVSRARNSGSLLYNGAASVLSNGIWLLVMVYVVREIESWDMRAAYILGATIGSVLMQWVAMTYLEKPKKHAARVALHAELETAFRLIERNNADTHDSFRTLTERLAKVSERLATLQQQLDKPQTALVAPKPKPRRPVADIVNVDLCPADPHPAPYGSARMPEVEHDVNLSVTLQTAPAKPKRKRKPRAKKNTNPDTIA
jgi:uncharacterized membrane-anchored protein YhcB (DUF1043 family)